MRKALVCGAGGFIGSHLVTRLRKEGYWVRGVDIKWPEFGKSDANEFIVADLRDEKSVYKSLIANQEFYFPIPEKFHEPVDEVYQLAADMGGAGYIFSGDHDANVMHNSALINLPGWQHINILSKEKSLLTSGV